MQRTKFAKNKHAPDVRVSRETALSDYELNRVVEKISLEKVSHEERRREAKKPLYLVRYE